MDFFNQGIPLGRWFGIRVLIHWTFLLFVGSRLLNARDDLPYEVIYTVVLFGTVLAHEFGHALSCRAVGGEAHQIILWPLGGIAFVQPPPKPWAWLITTVCGPLVNAILWPTFWAVNHFLLPRLPIDFASTGGQYLLSVCFSMEGINRILLLFNLIPAYPMDGGRILQEILWLTIGYPRSLMIAGMVGTVAGASFVCMGLGLFGFSIPVFDIPLSEKGVVSPTLAIIGVLCAMQSFGIYRRSQEIAGWRKN
jgi:Zn-dependent protease